MEYNAQILRESVSTMCGFYEVRGNEGALLKTGRRPFDPARAKFYLGNIEKCLPKLKEATEKFDKEYGVSQARND